MSCVCECVRACVCGSRLSWFSEHRRESTRDEARILCLEGLSPGHDERRSASLYRGLGRSPQRGSRGRALGGDQGALTPSPSLKLKYL